MILILVLYLLSTFLLGWTIVKKWFGDLPALLSIVAALLLGTGIGVPIAYFLAVLFSKTGEPMLWGTITASAAAIVISLRMQAVSENKKISLSEIALVVFFLVFSTWVMTKTFHGGAGGELFVGSNNVFDFGHSLGIIRSFSWGSGIPFMSPFFAGYPMFYHFFFTFWVAIWEYFGVPIVWAMNIPSIVSFASLLIVIFYVPQIIAKQKPIVGWLAVAFTITNSSLTFWKLLAQKTDIWHLPTYPFAGPFDGSTISIFVTLNSYVNQRHLAFATAFGLFLVLMFIRDIQHNALTIGRSALLGVLTGFLLLWNMVTYLLIGITMTLMHVLFKKWQSLLVFGIIAGSVGFVFLLPIADYLYRALILLNKLLNVGAGQAKPGWTMGEYFWQNLGILPVVAALGYMKLSKAVKRYMVPFIVLFLMIILFATFGNRGFEQKSFSYVIIWMNILVAVALGWLWQRTKTITVVVFTILTISGVVDLMPIKNEFAFPLIGKETLPVMSWIRTNTAKDSIFVSYADMIDPVALAGRRNYFGFFKNLGFHEDRLSIVRSIYSGDITLAKERGVSYVLVPKWQKNDFPYQVNLKTLPVRYEDAKYTVYAVE